MKSSKPSALRKRFWQKKGLWAAVLLLFAVGGGMAWYFLWGPNSVLAQSSSMTAPVSNIATVQRGDLQVTVLGSGTLESGRTVDLKFSTSGIVSQVNIKLGDIVAKGQVLAQLGNATSLKANIASYELQLLQAQKEHSDLLQNADVALAQSYQDWVTSKSDYNTALRTDQRTAYARCSEEVNVKYKAALDTALARLDQLSEHSYGTDAWIDARNNYDTALSNYTYCTTYDEEEKVEAKAALQVARTKMDQAESKYKILQGASGVDPDELAMIDAKIASLQTGLNQAKEDLDGITLTAPMDGKVVYLASEAGAIVDTSKFITLANMKQPQINVSVDESDMNNFVVGSSAAIVFDALPDKNFDGTVSFVEPALTTSNQYKVLKGIVKLNEDEINAVKNLPLGLNATVTIVYKEADDVLLAPVTALKQISGKGYQVTLIKDVGTTQTQPIEVGLMSSEYAEILSGLNEGDKIIAIVENASASKTANQNNDMMPPAPPFP